MSAIERPSFAYVVAVNGLEITLNLNQAYRGRVAGTGSVAVPLLQVGSRFVLRAGVRTLVAEVLQVEFAESAAAHHAGIGSTVPTDEPLRQIQARVLGTLEQRREVGSGRAGELVPVDRKTLSFRPGGLVTPGLGAAAYPLDRDEAVAVLEPEASGPRDVWPVEIGTDALTGLPVRVDLPALLSRHVAVLGSTGQGKSSFTAALLQQLMQSGCPGLRAVIFDVSGEYPAAFQGHLSCIVRHTSLGQERKIPYSALGREGLEALFLPSARAQLPAFRFALRALSYVQYDGENDVVKVAGEEGCLVETVRADGAGHALGLLRKLARPQKHGLKREKSWPSLRALAPLISEYSAITEGSGGSGSALRNGRNLEFVTPLLRRIYNLLDDDAFRRVVNCEGGEKQCESGVEDPYQSAQRSWVRTVFDHDEKDEDGKWSLNIVDLRHCSYDLLPGLLRALLQGLLAERFSAGPGKGYPTLLILEEAHHYVRRSIAEEPAPGELLAYERLAKEGRKFNLALWLSTQRPSELSDTVLAQCGTWFCLRLTSSADQERVRHASEWADKTLLQRLAGLARQEALAFGAAFKIPVHLRLPTADPTPQSYDPPWTETWREGKDTVGRSHRGSDREIPRQ